MLIRNLYYTNNQFVVVSILILQDELNGWIVPGQVWFSTYDLVVLKMFFNLIL